MFLQYLSKYLQSTNFRNKTYTLGGIAGYIENESDNSESLIRSCYYTSYKADSTATDILVADYNYL